MYNTSTTTGTEKKNEEEETKKKTRNKIKITKYQFIPLKVQRNRGVWSMEQRDNEK